MLAAAVCACVLLVLPAAALAGNGMCASASSGVVAEATADELQPDIDVADRPEAGHATVKHAGKKPRRANRRLRVRGWGKCQSVCALGDIRTADTSQTKLKRKRHGGKRSLMRRLMTVRGGLQA
jgi:hypothetical protein